MARGLCKAGYRFVGATAVLVVLVATATAAAPVRRGTQGYDPGARAAYESISFRHAVLIDQHAWAFLLEALEKEFFTADGGVTAAEKDAERRALGGYRESKRLFLDSLRNEKLDLESQVELAGGELDVDRAAISPEDYAPRAYANEALPASMIATFKDDMTLSGITFFSGSVSWTDDSLPGARRQELFTLSEAIYLILQDAMVPYRQATTAAIKAARTRWENYNDTVVAHQFPWEMAINELSGLTGTIERPPTVQIALLHPILAVEFADPNLSDAWKPADELSVKPSMLLNLAGFNLYDKDRRYGRKWGLAFCLSYRDGIDVPAWGPSLGVGRWVDVAYVWRRGAGVDTNALVFSADLWGLIKTKQSGFVRDTTEWLAKAQAFLN